MTLRALSVEEEKPITGFGKLGRYMGKPELGPEETNFGEVREREGRATMGGRGMEDRARTEKHRGPDGHRTRGAFGLARKHRKTGRKMPMCRVLNTKEPINLTL